MLAAIAVIAFVLLLRRRRKRAAEKKLNANVLTRAMAATLQRRGMGRTYRRISEKEGWAVRAQLKRRSPRK